MNSQQNRINAIRKSLLFQKISPFVEKIKKYFIFIDDFEYDPEPRADFAQLPFCKTFFENLDLSVFRERIHLLAKYNKWFEQISLHEEDPALPHWINIFMPSLDGMSIYAFLAERNPARYVECGSGHSTRFAAKAIRDHGLRTKIISIDPCPRAEIDALCDVVYRMPLEKMDFKLFAEMDKDDILLFDTSHHSFANSDVTMFYAAILPLLPKGVLYALHDIMLPRDYPASWKKRFYNEQYLLLAFLSGGGREIYFPCNFIENHFELSRELEAEVGKSRRPGGSLFWLERK